MRARTLSNEAVDELKKRQSFSLHGAITPQREGNLFEVFLLVGISAKVKVDAEKSKSYKPSVLFRYPPNANVSSLHVSQFCFPNGVKTKVVKRTQSSSKKNALLFGSLANLEKSNRSFVILLSGEKHLLYGVCVVNDELLMDPPSVLSGGSFLERNNRSKNDIIAPRCYCLLTKFPFFKLHFEILYNVLAQERLYRLEMEVSGNTSESEKKNKVVALFEFYFKQRVPREGESLTIKLDTDIRGAELLCPPGNEAKLICKWGLGCLVKFLPMDIFLQLYSALLQEEKLVLVCENLSVLSAAALSLLPLMRPLVWQGTFIPILPKQLHECLHAPGIRIEFFFFSN
eukprot:TRINITY_DN2515_c0_g1_i1.p1 TRINITY_DN2515_c0_g1~~TRINITY_DN2515_c0_g1_i1.p1  ORF type:complete len:343 (+),score=27.26 TRINITY_DN2515_c0_g1_i1:39-1067(+)